MFYLCDHMGVRLLFFTVIELTYDTSMMLLCDAGCGSVIILINSDDPASVYADI